MTALYPIGTQLITRRLSQAALYIDIIYGGCPWLCDLKIKNNEGKWIDVNEQLNCDESAYTIMQVLSKYFFNDGARVTVTEENQKWLSPAFVLELNNAREIIDSKTTYTQEVKDAVYDAFFELGYHRVIRTYPNGQRAPLIEWNEVILPEGAIA